MALILIILAIFLILVIVFAIASNQSSKSTYNGYKSKTSYISDSCNRKPKIGAEVSEDFYESIQEYCHQHSISIAALIRSAVESYIGTASISSSDVISTPPVLKKSAIVRPDGFWKCPICGLLNARYVGTCSCGGTKDSTPKPVSRRPSYIRKDGSWKCPKCGNINASYVGTCSCGKAKE